MKNLSIHIAIIISSLYFVGCSNHLYKKANKEFENLQYSDAIKDYNKVLSKRNNHDAKIKLANSYRLINDLEKAAPLFAEIVNYPESNAINKCYYAKILMSLGDYNKAAIWYKHYLAVVPDDKVSQISLATCNAANPFLRDTTLYSLKLIHFPSLESAFSPVPYNKGMIFTANIKPSLTSSRDPWSGKSYYDLYFAKKDRTGNWSSPELIHGKVNGSYHEGPATFNKNKSIAYFTRSNYFKHILRKSSNNENNLKIFKAKIVDGNWEQIEEMPFNSDEYSVGHPSLASDQKTLYFISDMPGGKGKTDIYKSVFDGKKWGEPENLGDEINTAGNEMFPTINEDGTLYFSSDSHTNMGGLDVFSTSFDKKNNKWLPVENLNYPLNSTKDDFSFVFNKDNKTGFISSNRSGTDEIYQFAKNDPTFNLFGVVIEKGKGIPIENATVTITDYTNNNKKSTVQTDKNGKYKIKLEPEANYIALGSIENNFSRSSEISTKGKKYSEEFERNFELDSLIFNFNLFGKVTEKGTGLPFKEATITLKTNNAKTLTIQTNKDGEYKTKLAPEILYEGITSKEDYFTEYFVVSTKGKKGSEEFERNFELEKIVLQKPILVENVFYDLAKWDIRPDAKIELDKLVRLLTINPGISINLGSHTDSRSGDNYNKELSEKRAKEVVNYLISQGIDANRLEWKGYGETQLINKCKNGVKCSEEEHQKNRRTEFMVVKK